MYIPINSIFLGLAESFKAMHWPCQKKTLNFRISKVHWFCKFRWLHRKNHIKIFQTTTSFYAKKENFKLIKNRFFLVKKCEIQVIVSMVMLARSSEWIFNTMRYTGFLMWWNFLSRFMARWTGFQRADPLSPARTGQLRLPQPQPTHGQPQPGLQHCPWPFGHRQNAGCRRWNFSFWNSYICNKAIANLPRSGRHLYLKMKLTDYLIFPTFMTFTSVTM